MAKRLIQFNDADRPLLPAMLDEFRTALEEEIEAAKRNLASSAVAITNGRRMSKVEAQAKAAGPRSKNL